MTRGKNPVKLNIHATLFDVDGTIIFSEPAIAEFWRDFGKDKPYFDAEEVIAKTHGRRTFDAIAQYAPDYAQVDYVNELESTIPDKYGSKAIEIPGSVKLVTDILDLQELEGKQRLAVGTSGTFSMASKWFALLGLKRPDVFITAESVKLGKPNPEPYLLGRQRLGYDGDDHKVIVFEDAPAGIVSGKAAGCFVIGIASTLGFEEVIKAGADLVVPDLKSIKVNKFDPEADTFELLVEDYHYFAPERMEKFGFKV